MSTEKSGRRSRYVIEAEALSTLRAAVGEDNPYYLTLRNALVERDLLVDAVRSAKGKLVDAGLIMRGTAKTVGRNILESAAVAFHILEMVLVKIGESNGGCNGDG
jgi:hypothetical protein